MSWVNYEYERRLMTGGVELNTPDNVDELVRAAPAFDQSLPDFLELTARADRLSQFSHCPQAQASKIRLLALQGQAAHLKANELMLPLAIKIEQYQNEYRKYTKYLSKCNNRRVG